jgi:hypothetical protein
LHWKSQAGTIDEPECDHAYFRGGFRPLGLEDRMSRWQPCQVGGCIRPAHIRGLCDAHYKRLRVSGSVQAEQPVRSLMRRIKRLEKR